MSRGGAPSVVRKQEIEAARQALIAAGGEAVHAVLSEVKPIIEQLTRDVDELRSFSHASIECLHAAAGTGSEEAREFLHALGLWHSKPRRWRNLWRALVLLVRRR